MGKLASIAADIFQARRSHVEAKKCYGSKINKDELIRVTIGLAEPLRGGDIIRCLFMSQRSGRIYNVVQRVRGNCKVIPTKFMIKGLTF
jgi:hypothetical protein